MLLSTILKDNPKLQGILFDLPHAIESAGVYFQGFANSNDNNNDILSRCKLIDGDFFNSIPVVDADGYIIKNVILNWDDEAATVILKNCLQAMKTNHAKRKINARLLVIDIIMPESSEPFIGKFTDILMLALTRKGRIRTEIEFRNLLDSSGFDTVNIIRSHDPVNPLSIIEALPSK